jgi:ABC-type multidrug transport system permease subunit
MFIKDWSDWKGNLKRLVGIALFNLALLFVLGYQTFINFLTFIRTVGNNPYVNVTNLSIQSFTLLTTRDAIERLQLDRWAWISQYSWLLQVTLISFVLLPLLLICYRAYKLRKRGLNTYLLLACTIGALLIPTISHDYKLSILPVSMVIALCGIAPRTTSRVRFFSALLVYGISLAYATTLFSFANKPLLLMNNLPALMVILWSFTMLDYLDNEEKYSTSPLS